MQNDILLERVGFGELRRKIDKENGVVEGVKILGTKSRNNRIYPFETLKAAAPLYENAKVNVNHPDGPADEARKYQDRVGSIKNVKLERDGLYGDFHFNPKHPLAEQLIWDAERAPENLGFSHNVEAVVRVENGTQIVEEIKRVRSVDVVADPATTDGLFESVNRREQTKYENAELQKRDAQIAELREERDGATRRFEIARRLLEKFTTESDADAVRLAFKNKTFLDALFETEISVAERVLEERLETVREALDFSAKKEKRERDESSETVVSQSRADLLFAANDERNFAAAIKR